MCHSCIQATKELRGSTNVTALNLESIPPMLPLRYMLLHVPFTPFFTHLLTPLLHRQAIKELRGNTKVTDQDPESKYEALTKYARDLTQAAREGKLDPVIGRDDEIRR